MASLGSFGTARPPADFTFEWFGAEMRVHPDFSDLAIVSLFSELDAADKGDDDMGAAAALMALTNLTAKIVHEEDHRRFVDISIANRQTIEDIAALAMTIVEALSGHPSQLPSDSSDGQRPTNTRSAVDSSSRALELLDGRPDLQVAVLRAREAVAAN